MPTVKRYEMNDIPKCLGAGFLEGVGNTQVFQRDRLNMTKHQTSCPVQNVLKQTRDCSVAHAAPPLHKTMFTRFRKRSASKVVKMKWTQKIWAKMAGLMTADDSWCLMFILSPENLNPKVLGTPSRNCSDASPTSMLSGAWRSKKYRSFKTHPSVPPKMYIPLAASLHTAVCARRTVGAVPVKVTSDHVAACPQRGWKRNFGFRFGDIRLDSKCQKPHKMRYKNISLQKNTESKGASRVTPCI